MSMAETGTLANGPAHRLLNDLAVAMGFLELLPRRLHIEGDLEDLRGDALHRLERLAKGLQEVTATDAAKGR
jgi:hypothetical protein